MLKWNKGQIGAHQCEEYTVALLGALDWTQLTVCLIIFFWAIKFIVTNTRNCQKYWRFCTMVESWFRFFAALQLISTIRAIPIAITNISKRYTVVSRALVHQVACHILTSIQMVSIRTVPDGSVLYPVIDVIFAFYCRGKTWRCWVSRQHFWCVSSSPFVFF